MDGRRETSNGKYPCISLDQQQLVDCSIAALMRIKTLANVAMQTERMSCTACFQASCGFALTDRSIFDMSVDTLPLRAEGRAEDIYTSGWNFDSDTKLPLVRKRKRTPRSNVSTLEDLAQVKFDCRDC